jgi:O-acetyl-ADP-ribose deacetylase (regulator of RNase III)
MSAGPTQRRFGATDIVLKQGDITREEVDAIVNAANSRLAGGGGVDGAIHQAGGRDIMRECDAIRTRQGGCPAGQAVITGAGRLHTRYVVHAVGPVWNGGNQGESDLLRSAYRNSLAIAAKQGAKTIALPALSTGVYGYPLAPAAAIALETAREYALAHDDFSEIRFVLFSDRSFTTFTRTLARLPDADTA